MRVLVTGVCLTAFACPALAEDVQMKDLPDAVMMTVEKESKEAIIEDIERKEKKDGTVYYELEIERGDEDWKIHIDEDGKVLKRKRDS